jgi:hypothetical protein
MAETDQKDQKEEGFPPGEPPSRAAPAQPAFIPSAWPSDRIPPAPSLLKPAAAGASAAPPATFSFGEVPAAPSAAETARAAPPEAPPDVPPEVPQAPASLAITTTPPDPKVLEMELAAAREEIRALHEMLEDLPEIFERKFQQRLATVLEHQKHLLADNQALRNRLYGHSVPDTDGPGSGPLRSQPVLLSTVARKEGWGQALKRALRLGRPQKISRHDDGRPITA